MASRDCYDVRRLALPEHLFQCVLEHTRRDRENDCIYAHEGFREILEHCQVLILKIVLQCFFEKFYLPKKMALAIDLKTICGVRLLEFSITFFG